MRLPPDHKYPWDEEQVKSEDPEDKVSYFKNLVQALNKAYRDVSNIITVNYDLLAGARYYPNSVETDQGVVGARESTKAIIDAIGSNRATIVFRHVKDLASSTYIFLTTLIIPGNITVVVEEGALLSPASTKTVTVNGKFIGAPKVITGAGTVIINAQKINVTWYASSGDGSYGSKWVNALRNAFAANNGRCRYHSPRGDYEDATTIVLDHDVVVGYTQFTGDGVGVTRYFYNQTDDTSLMKLCANAEAAGLLFTVIRGMSFHGQLTATGAALEIVRASRMVVEDVGFWDFNEDTTHSKGVWTKGHENIRFRNISMYRVLKCFHLDENPGDATIDADIFSFEKIQLNPDDQDNGYGFYITSTSGDVRLYNCKFGPNVNISKAKYAIYWDAPNADATCVGFSIEELRVEQGDTGNKDCWALYVNYGSVVERINIKNTRLSSSINGIDIATKPYTVILDGVNFAMGAGYTAYDIDSYRLIFQGIKAQVAATKTIGSDLFQLHGDSLTNPYMAEYSTNNDYFLPARITFSDALIHQYVTNATKAANHTCTEFDVGKELRCTADAVVFTLPATVLGYNYTFINWGADGDIGFSVSPNANDKIMGVNINPAADDKDLVNTKATAIRGDLIEIEGDGDLGWYVRRMYGTWAREA